MLSRKKNLCTLHCSLAVDDETLLDLRSFCLAEIMKIKIEYGRCLAAELQMQIGYRRRFAHTSVQTSILLRFVFTLNVVKG